MTEVGGDGGGGYVCCIKACCEVDTWVHMGPRHRATVLRNDGMTNMCLMPI